MELVDATDTLSTKKKVERLFLVFGPPMTIENKKLLSFMLIDWVTVCRMIKPNKKTGCPYHRPVSNNQRLRTFFASMKRVYAWPMCRRILRGGMDALGLGWKRNTKGDKRNM